MTESLNLKELRELCREYDRLNLLRMPVYEGWDIFEFVQEHLTGEAERRPDNWPKEPMTLRQTAKRKKKGAR